MARCDNKHSRPQPPCYVCAVIYDPLCLQNNTWRWAPPGPSARLRGAARGWGSAAGPGGRGAGARLGPRPPRTAPGRACAPRGHGRAGGRGGSREAEIEAGKQRLRQGSRQGGREAGREAGGEAARSPALPQPGGRRERRADPAPRAPHHLLEPMLKAQSAVSPDTAFYQRKIIVSSFKINTRLPISTFFPNIIR